MWSDPSGRSPARSRRGFTLIEVMVALIVAIIISTALVRFFAGVPQRGRAGAPSRSTPGQSRGRCWTRCRAGPRWRRGTTVGAAGGYAWQMEATSMAQMLAPVAPPIEAPAEDIGQDEAVTPPPVPMRLRVVVTGPRGGTVRLETVRLARASGDGDAP